VPTGGLGPVATPPPCHALVRFQRTPVPHLVVVVVLLLALLALIVFLIVGRRRVALRDGQGRSGVTVSTRGKQRQGNLPLHTQSRRAQAAASQRLYAARSQRGGEPSALPPPALRAAAAGTRRPLPAPAQPYSPRSPPGRARPPPRQSPRHPGRGCRGRAAVSWGLARDWGSVPPPPQQNVPAAPSFPCIRLRPAPRPLRLTSSSSSSSSPASPPPSSPWHGRAGAGSVQWGRASLGAHARACRSGRPLQRHATWCTKIAIPALLCCCSREPRRGAPPARAVWQHQQRPAATGIPLHSLLRVPWLPQAGHNAPPPPRPPPRPLPGPPRWAAAARRC
jgi:hypothetical protein